MAKRAGGRIITQVPVACDSCPFRKDQPIYLRKARRVEIATVLLNGGEFPCHGTVDYSFEDEHGETYPNVEKSLRCAGAAKSLLAIGCSTQMMRIEERLGMLDMAKAEESPVEVWDLHEWQRLPEGATGDNPDPEDDEEEIETCNTVNEGCLAPAGYVIGGGVVEGTEAADGECTACGEGLCSNCADKDGRCFMCTEEEE